MRDEKYLFGKQGAGESLSYVSEGDSRNTETAQITITYTDKDNVSQPVILKDLNYQSLLNLSAQRADLDNQSSAIGGLANYLVSRLTSCKHEPALRFQKLSIASRLLLIVSRSGDLFLTPADKKEWEELCAESSAIERGRFFSSDALNHILEGINAKMISRPDSTQGYIHNAAGVWLGYFLDTSARQNNLQIFFGKIGVETQTVNVEQTTLNELKGLARKKQFSDWREEALHLIAKYLVRRLDHCDGEPSKRFSKLSIAAQAFNLLKKTSAETAIFSKADQQKWNQLVSLAQDSSATLLFCESRELALALNSVNELLLHNDKILDDAEVTIYRSFTPGQSTGPYVETITRQDSYDQAAGNRSIVIKHWTEENSRKTYKPEITINGYFYQSLARTASQKDEPTASANQKAIAWICAYLHSRLDYFEMNSDVRIQKIQLSVEILEFLKALPASVSDVTQKHRQTWLALCERIEKSGGELKASYFNQIQRVLTDLNLGSGSSVVPMPLVATGSSLGADHISAEEIHNQL